MKPKKVFVALAGSLLSCAIAAEAADIELTPPVRERCLAVLRQGLASDEFWPSMHAAEALSVAGRGEEVRRALGPKLKTEKDDQKRCGLARELVRAGDGSQVTVLLSVLSLDDAYGHTHAAESLYKVDEIGDGALLQRAMAQQEDAPLRLMAAAALGRCGSPYALARLRQELAGKDPQITRLAAWALARIGNQSDIPQIRIAAKQATDPVTRSFFEHALAALGDQESLAAVKRNLSDENSDLRTYAAVCVGDAREASLADRLRELLDDSVLDVRVRAAQSLLVLSQPAPRDMYEDISRDVYPAFAANPRYSEGSIISLRDGTLLYATTEFIGGGDDASTAQVIGRASRDEGRSWGPPRVLQENIGKQNVMSVTLRRLAHPAHPGSPIGMFYLVKNSADDLDVHLRISRDEAATFEPSILVSGEPGYHVMNNDRVTLLSSGRLLAPVATSSDVHKDGHFVSYCFLSDDAGRTWRSGRGKADVAKRGAMEPEVIEMRDGGVAMIIRTQLGYIAVSYSTDGGDTWSEPTSWNVKAPEAPATLRRIPATGDWMLIWNDTYNESAGHGGQRTPLTAAISTDEGRSWKHVRNLESRPDQSYAYTSLTFVKHRAVLSYYVCDEKTGRISSRFRSLPVAWFYGGQSTGGEP